MRKVSLKLAGALLMLTSAASAAEPSNTATGALAVGQKAEGTCDCWKDTSKHFKPNAYNGLMPDGAAPARKDDTNPTDKAQGVSN